jgi:hypothetical protein
MRSRTATLLQTNAVVCNGNKYQNWTRIENMKVQVINRKYKNTIMRPLRQTPISYTSNFHSPLPDHSASHPTQCYLERTTLVSSRRPPPQSHCCLSVRSCAAPLLDNDWSTPSVTILAHSWCSGDVLPAHRSVCGSRDRCV